MKGDSNQTKQLVSIVMPVYNCEDYLVDAIESILSQTYSRFELIIINDGSTDQSGEIINKYAKTDKRIRYYKQPNKGLVRTLNIGFRKAKGKYIARMDSDDISEKERLRKQVSYMESNPGIGVLGTAYTAINQNNQDLFKNQMFAMDALIRLDSVLRNPFGHGTIMLRKKITEEVGLYDESLSYTEDYEYWWRLSRATKLANLKESLYKWRIVESSMSHSRHFENQKIIVKLKKRIWDGTKKDIPDLLKVARKEYKRSSLREKEVVLDMLIALHFYLKEKNEKQLNDQLLKLLLCIAPMKSLKKIRIAIHQQILGQYDIKRICSDARGEIYD